MKANNDIREYAKSKNVCLWQIADELGMQDSAFSRKLRRELPDIAKSKIRDIIDKISNDMEKINLFG